jgi:hypothetical protein
MAKFKFYVSTGYVGSDREEVIEIPDEELEGMSESEIEDYVHENYYNEWLWSIIDATFWRVDK